MLKARLGQLQRLAQALGRAETPDAAIAVATATIHETVPGGAVFAWLADPSTSSLVRVAADGYDGDGLVGFERLPLDGDLPVHDALRTGAPVFLASRAERAARYPRIGDGSNAPFQAWAAIPLVIEQRAVGAISVSFPEPRTFDEDDAAHLLAIGTLCAQTIDRTRLFQAERGARDLAETLLHLGASFSRELDEGRLIQLVVDASTELVGARHGAFFYNGTDAQGEAYVLHAIAGADREQFARFPNPRPTPIFAPTFRGEGVIRLDDVRADERFGRWGEQPPGHPPVVSYLAVPVVTRTREVLGGLFFGHPEPGRFTAAHEHAILGIATQAAIALENARLYRALRDSEARARDAERKKDEFLAILGHELRNPLAPIITALQLMQLRGVSAGRERDVIARQVDHLARLVDDLLDVSRITRGKIELKREPLELGAVITQAIEMASPLVERRRHSLEVEVAREGLRVVGDATRLAQVFANLLTNAAKYTEVGGHVAVRAAREGDAVVVRVSDDGIGIHPDLLPRVFEMFTQGRRKLDRAEGGLGLGLTLVKSLVELHDGTVAVASDGPGRGSCFSVSLPAAPAGAKAATPTPPAGAPIASRRRVLVVDDNEDAAELIADALRELGHEVAVAHDGLRAISVADDFRPDVGLLDIGLPVLDGYELASRLRGVLGGARLRLVAITGYGQEHDRRRALDAGFDDHVVKPIDLDRLHDLVVYADSDATRSP